MAHRYGEAILVRRGSAAAPGAANADSAGNPAAQPPASFAWRGVWYRVDAILATWRLRDRWWAGGNGAPEADVTDVADVADDVGAGGMRVPRTNVQADVLAPTERVYYRVLCRDPGGVQVFDLYEDAASGRWMLDRAHD